MTTPKQGSTTTTARPRHRVQHQARADTIDQQVAKVRVGKRKAIKLKPDWNPPSIDDQVKQVAKGKGPNLTGAAAAPDTAHKDATPNEMASNQLSAHMFGVHDKLAPKFALEGQPGGQIIGGGGDGGPS